MKKDNQNQSGDIAPINNKAGTGKSFALSPDWKKEEESMTPKQSALARFDEKFTKKDESYPIGSNRSEVIDIINLKSFLSEMYDEAEREGREAGMMDGGVIQGAIDSVAISKKARQEAIKEVIEEIPESWAGSNTRLKQQLREKYGI